MAKKAYIGVAEATNLVNNGSFETTSNWGTWNADASWDSSQAYSGSKSLKITGSDLANASIATPIVGHKYYGREYVKTSGNVQPTDCRFEMHGGDGEGLNWVFAWNRGNYSDWTMLSDVHTINSVNASSYVVRTFALDISSNAIWIDGLMIIDLTATYGAGKEPTKEWCDVNIPFFEGTASVPAPAGAGVAREIKKCYAGDVDNKARRIKKAYIGIGGVARPCWGNGELAYWGKTSNNLGSYCANLSATTVGDYALFGGGADGYSDYFTNSVRAYNRSLVRSVPTGLYSEAYQQSAATVGNRAIFFSGSRYYSDHVTIGINTEYTDSLTRSVSTSPSVARRLSSGASVGAYAVFAGGINWYLWDEETGEEEEEHSNVVDAYTASLTRTTTTLSSARSQMAATSVGEYALFAGGLYGNARTDMASTSSVVDVFNTSLTRLTATSLPETAYGAGATRLGDYAIFAGGSKGITTYRSTVCAYDKSLTRHTLQALSSQKSSLQGTSVGNFALFGGGRLPSGIDSAVEVYDNSLTKVANASMSTTRMSHAATTVGNYALFGGGIVEYTKYTVAPAVDVYTIV